ncbi:MAG: hypothetical protein KGS49_09795 [Planctomycetes bacterium]|nr:hypothetical protein [Planctomycetota bacterium]
MSHNSHRNHHQHSISDLKRLASGRWREILTAAGLPAELLADRRGKPCPKCGGRDRFASLPDFDTRGSLICRHCHNASSNPRSGDGLASLQWWLGCSMAEAIVWLRSFLGLGVGKHIPVQAIKPTMAPPPKPVQSESDRLRIELMADVCRRNLTGPGIAHLAKQLGVHPQSLRQLQVGWCASLCATTWPMRDGIGNIIGVRTREPVTAAKGSMSGGNGGLFYDPDRIANIESGARIWIAEGPTDTAALLTLGLDAVGIPSAKSGGDQLLELGRRILPSEIVIVADGDDSGIESARKLRSELVIVAGVRIILPPVGIKDAREWINRGASRVDLENEAGAAEVFKFDCTDGGAA